MRHWGRELNAFSLLAIPAKCNDETRRQKRPRMRGGDGGCLATTMGQLLRLVFLTIPPNPSSGSSCLLTRLLGTPMPIRNQHGTAGIASWRVMLKLRGTARLRTRFELEEGIRRWKKNPSNMDNNPDEEDDERGLRRSKLNVSGSLGEIDGSNDETRDLWHLGTNGKGGETIAATEGFLGFVCASVVLLSSSDWFIDSSGCRDVEQEDLEKSSEVRGPLGGADLRSSSRR